MVGSVISSPSSTTSRAGSLFTFSKTKSSALQSFTEFRTAAEKILGYPIVFLHIDNTPKLVEGQFCDYCTMHGITYEKTVPDASQQNGIAE
jgi:hypothetical protein